jgi:hypothetical protein
MNYYGKKKGGKRPPKRWKENKMEQQEHSPLPVRGMRTAKNRKKPPKR